jgi:hypothetical protein
MPIALVVVYALFRMAEYFALKHYQALAADGFGTRNNPVLMVFGIILLPARIIGWIFLIWLAVKIGVLPTIVLVAIAFVLSLVLQSTIGMLLIGVLGPLAGVIYLALVPILAVVIGFMIAAL